MLNDAAILISISLMYSTPLIYTALAGVISENAGVVNIGLEGMMTIGAFAGAAAGYYSGNPWVGFLTGGLAGALLSLLHAAACVTFRADQVVSGIAINFIGPGLSLFLCRMMFGGTDTKPIRFEDKIPIPFKGIFADNSFLGIIFNEQYATVYLSFVLVFIVWIMLYKTKLGLRIRSVGENPKAADTLGINVFAIRYFAVIASGFLAGLGGASLSLALVSYFRSTLVSGQGFIALAAMIFGKWKPQGAMFSCLIFGASIGLEVFLKSRINSPLLSPILAMIPYVLTLVILIGFVGKSKAPSADGVPYDKGNN